VVVDATTGQPIVGARVTVLGTDAVVTTERWGSFAFAGVNPGRVSLQVSAPDRPTTVQNVEVSARGVVFVQIVLPSLAAVLEELVVSGTRGVGPSDAAQTAADLLADRVPGLRVRAGSVGDNDRQVRLRSANTFQGNGAPLILIDGVVLTHDDRGYGALEQIPAADVAEIQVLDGPSAAFRYPYAAGGVINVVTKKGGAAVARSR
jgi:outer membrane receptor protein involved in Fe transport